MGGGASKHHSCSSVIVEVNGPVQKITLDRQGQTTICVTTICYHRLDSAADNYEAITKKEEGILNACRTFDPRQRKTSPEPVMAQGA
jgi:hypothetical protein